jgi:hypothetical protein
MRGVLLLCSFVLFAAWVVGVKAVLVLVIVVGILLAVLLRLFKMLFDAMFFSIAVVPPPANEWDDVDLSSCSLFSFLPVLKDKVAWKPLGCFPTPLDQFEIALPNGKVRVLKKL